MIPEQYPPQEPLSEAGQAYSLECLARSAGIAFEEASYGPDPYQTVATFRPDRPNGTVLVFWHGGGWTSGYKEWNGFMAPALAERGITLVSPGYRLAPKHLFPDGVQDCIAAVAWVHANAARLGARQDAIYLGGHSAGGHYAALLAARRDWQARAGLPPDVVRGCLPVSGMYDFTSTSGLTMRPRFLGAAGNEIAASPQSAIEAPLPPFLLAWGEKDFPHLAKQAVAFEQALRAAGARVETLCMPGRTHFSAHYAGGEAEGPWMPRALAFLGA